MLKSTSFPALVIRVSGRWQGFEDGMREWGDEPVLVWSQPIASRGPAGSVNIQLSWGIHPGTAMEMGAQDLQGSAALLLGKGISHIHLLLQRTQVKEYGDGLYPGSDSSSITYSSLQDQGQMQNSWRRIWLWWRSMMVSHPSNRLCSKNVGWR